MESMSTDTMGAALDATEGTKIKAEMIHSAESDLHGVADVTILATKLDPRVEAAWGQKMVDLVAWSREQVCQMTRATKKPVDRQK